MNIFIEEKKEAFDESIEFAKKEFMQIRSGRAHSGLVDNLVVEVYGTATPLKQIASISVPDAISIAVEPYDKSVIKDIERSLSMQLKGMSLSNEGALLRIRVPSLTEETRKELLKVISEKAEKARISLRKVRDAIKEDITNAHKNKEISEDEFYSYKKELDEITSAYSDQVEALREKKEHSMMEI